MLEINVAINVVTVTQDGGVFIRTGNAIKGKMHYVFIRVSNADES